MQGWRAALFPLLLLKYLPAAFGWQGKLANALGIGYFTLQLISYLCDVRRGKLLPEDSMQRLLCYASFFLSITQGPFNRYDELMPQMGPPCTMGHRPRLARCAAQCMGIFQKAGGG